MKKAISRLLYPYRCPGCGDLIGHEDLVCDRCRKSFTELEPPFCMRCGRHILSAEAELCNECQHKSHHYETGMSVFAYDSFMKQSMSNFKFNGFTDNADYYVSRAVDRCGDRIRGFEPDALIPVPIHRSRRAYRGYNQAELLADDLGQALGIRVVKDLLIRRHKTAYQKQLGAGSRRTNIEHAFACNDIIYGRAQIERDFGRLLLVDDIYTTGSTLDACAKTLLQGGARHVAVLSICMGQGY